jgi:hypothetical protein
VPLIYPDCLAEVGFYADPSGRTVHVARWEAQYHRRLRVKAKQNEPISLWHRGKTTSITSVVEQIRATIASGESSHDGSSALMRHVLNARWEVAFGYLVYKAYPDSPDKIDCAAVMAWVARLDAVAKEIGRATSKAAKQWWC